MIPDHNDTSGITYRASLPLRWQKDDRAAASTQALRSQINIDLLRALATLEAAPLERDHESDTHTHKALERLEAKLDVALTLLARVIADRVQLPSSVPVVLGVGHIEWISNETMPQPGDNIAVTLYLSPRLPEPLVFTAMVRHAAEGKCIADFTDHDPELKEWTTRTLFRYHRRALQIRRSQ